MLSHGSTASPIGEFHFDVRTHATPSPVLVFLSPVFHSLCHRVYVPSKPFHRTFPYSSSGALLGLANRDGRSGKMRRARPREYGLSRLESFTSREGRSHFILSIVWNDMACRFDGSRGSPTPPTGKLVHVEHDHRREPQRLSLVRS